MRRTVLFTIAAAVFALFVLSVDHVWATAVQDPSDSISVDIETSPYRHMNREVGGVRLVDSAGELIEPEPDRSRGLIWFTDLADGEYSLRIDDPRWAPFERDGLKPGKRAMALLTPSSGVVLRVLDDATGEPLPKYGLSVRLDHVNWSPNEYKLQSARRRPPQDGFHGIPPYHCTLLVTAKNYGPEAFTVGELQVGERREVTVRMRKAVTIEGRVTLHDGVTAVGGAFVFLREPGEDVSFFQADVLSTPPMSPPLQALRADENGHFEFSAAPGKYALHVMQDAWHAVAVDPFVVDASAEDADFAVLLPPAGALEGRITGGDLADLTGYRVQPMPQSGGLDTWLTIRDRSVPLRADGSFRIDLLPAGLTELLLFWPTEEDADWIDQAGWSPEGVIQIGGVEIEVGPPLQREFAIADRWPAKIRMALTVNGAPAVDFMLTVESEADPGHRYQADCNERGIATLIGVPPGEFVLHVGAHSQTQSQGARWDVPVPGRFTVEPGATLELEHALTTTTGRVQIFEAGNGLPVAYKSVNLRHIGGSSPVGPTDGDGWLELTLPPGRFQIERTEHYDPPRVDARWMLYGELRWTKSGPASPRLELTGLR